MYLFSFRGFFQSRIQANDVIVPVGSVRPCVDCLMVISLRFAVADCLDLECNHFVISQISAKEPVADNCGRHLVLPRATMLGSQAAGLAP
jgi:hypothetical protein